MLFNGRGVKSPVITTIDANENELTVRIDDDSNPEFWAELTLTWDEVVELLGKMRPLTKR